MEATHERVKVIPHGSDDARYRKPQSPESYIYDEYALGWRRGYYRGNIYEHILMYSYITRIYDPYNTDSQTKGT